MKKILTIIILFLVSCTKTGWQHSETWVIEDLTSLYPGQYCLPQPDAKLDTVNYNWTSTKHEGIYLGKTMQVTTPGSYPDSNGVFHIKRWKEMIKSQDIPY